MRVLADAMLGSLARWLRTLGYDTLYDSAWSDNELVRRARADSRVLLTRDTKLARRRNLDSLLITSQVWDEQVRQVLRELPMPRPQPYSRCLVCNELLLPILADEAWGMVPPFVFIHHEQFKLCPECNQVFWRGTHWERMNVMVASFCEFWERVHQPDQ